MKLRFQTYAIKVADFAQECSGAKRQ